jgi:hypothetical protein
MGRGAGRKPIVGASGLPRDTVLSCAADRKTGSF